MDVGDLKIDASAISLNSKGDPDECECELNALNVKIQEVRRCLGFLW